MTPTLDTPVRLTARLDTPLSRWLWLVKWILAIPHVIVLVFLWLAVLVVSIVALVAVLINRRYPDALFDFVVGVLRWSWRVTWYAYGGLGTDRYPPFTLAEVPDYPATLEVARPGELSRGLVLVKWWLLAIPHYLVLAVFAGSSTADGGTIGLTGLLVLFVGIALLFTGRYPRGLFDLIVGVQRWVYRVAAYALLLTDAYPPFRLDQGGAEPGEPVPGPGPTPVAAPRTG